MADYNTGKGVYIWRADLIEGGDPGRILARLQMAGVQSVALKLCDGRNIQDGLEKLIQVLRDNKIRVVGWGYSYLDKVPREEAQAAANACKRYVPDFYLVDVEKEVERNYAGAHAFVDVLRPALPNMALGLNSFWSPPSHPGFPWAVFLNAVDFVCPQVYWRGVDPVGKLSQSQQEYANIPQARQVPMPVVAGDMYVRLGVKPTPEQVTQFLAAADGDPFIKGVFMWAADDAQTTPELWQAFSHYQWKKGDPDMPKQPLGWAKVKAKGGLYIRSAPLGGKVGALAKDELAPIWSVTDTKWAAINSNRDRWIFVGNPNLVDLTMDTSNVPPPPPGMYQAKVIPARGLNVRDAAVHDGIFGKVVRALPVGTMVQVYEEKDGWVRINPTQSEWVSAQYLSKMS
jgi:hypothetical protein